MISQKEMFYTLFGALTMVDYIPFRHKRQMIEEIASKFFNISKEELDVITEELEKTLEYMFKQVKNKGVEYNGV